MAEVDIEQMKNQFTAEFENLVRVKQLNSFLLSSKQYDEHVNSVLQAKQSTSLTKLQRRRLKRYDVYTIEGIQKLIVPMKQGDSSIIYYLKNEEIFDVLYDIHVSVRHGGKHRMLGELKKKYKNVTQEMVLLFLKCCTVCQTKRKSIKKDIIAKPILSSDQKDSRCQVDFIDMQSSTDDKYNFVMIYTDQLTKFVQLRALVTKTVKEVANNLLDIFCIFGPPEILQSENGREFVDKTIEKLRSMWKGLSIVCSESEESIIRANQDIENMLDTWMIAAKCNQWSEGLKFVQFMKNEAYNDDIKTSPFKAMFGNNAKAGTLSKELRKDLRTEEDLLDDHSSINELPLSVEISSQDDIGEQSSQRNNQSSDSDTEARSPNDNQRKRKRTEDSISGDQESSICNCKSKCDTKRCKCKASGIFCDSRCHSNSSCCNKVYHVELNTFTD